MMTWIWHWASFNVKNIISKIKVYNEREQMCISMDIGAMDYNTTVIRSCTADTVNYLKNND